LQIKNKSQAKKSTAVSQIQDYSKQARNLKKDNTSPRNNQNNEVTATDQSHPFYPPNFRNTDKRYDNSEVGSSDISKRFQPLGSADVSNQ